MQKIKQLKNSSLEGCVSIHFYMLMWKTEFIQNYINTVSTTELDDNAKTIQHVICQYVAQHKYLS